jgi:hypothetical protein
MSESRCVSRTMRIGPMPSTLLVYLSHRRNASALFGAYGRDTKLNGTRATFRDRDCDRKVLGAASLPTAGAQGDATAKVEIDARGSAECHFG